MIKAAPIRKPESAAAAVGARMPHAPAPRPNAHLVHAILQRKEDERAHKPGACRCDGCAGKAKTGWLQRKLGVGAAHDSLEREADRVADRVLATSATSGLGRSPLKIQRAAAVPAEATDQIPESVPRALASHGRPLDAPLRGAMEQRFGHDFSRVRVHQGSTAAQSARDVAARAYTAGSHIVFGAGEFRPATGAGRSLLAHELTHVIQQGQSAPLANAAGGGGVLRPGTGAGAGLGVPVPGCVAQRGDVAGERFFFEFNSDELKAGQDKLLECFVHRLPAGTTLKVHGFASSDGDPAYNMRLSCHRANRASNLIGAIRSDIVRAQPNAMHGATPGAADDRRSAVIELVSARDKTKADGTCGPEVKDWFLTQAARAATDSRVVAIQKELSAADALARRHGSTAQAAAEGGTSAMVQKEELEHLLKGRKLANARPGADIAAAESAGKGFAKALLLDPVDMVIILAQVNKAAKAWKALVGHGADYDFKVNAMKDPSTDCCPTSACHHTVTICAGFGAENCYPTDLPGNLFYALIGRFVGFSERTLQLGSQYAQLTSPGTVSWDPPSDTTAISVGFGLLPLSESKLCSAVHARRGSYAPTAKCSDCRQPTTAGFK